MAWRREQRKLLRPAPRDETALAQFLRARSIDAPKNPGYYVQLIQKAISNNRIFMPEVIVRKGEPIDRALKRLKNKLDAEGIMEEVRRLRAFETPSQKVRRKAKLAAKRGKLKFRFNP